MDEESKDGLKRLAQEGGLDPEMVLAALGADLDPEVAAVLAGLAQALAAQREKPGD